MDDRHVMRLIKAAEKIAADLDRIAAALEAANAADPVAMIGKVLEAEAKQTAQNGDPLADIPESERYRFQ